MGKLIKDNFSKELKKIVEMKNESDLKVINDAFFYADVKLISSIVKMTPVDTGRARANWFLESEHSDKVTVDTQKVSTKKIKELIDKLPEELINVKLVLFNNLPYINKLEYGSSDQAPSGMVRVSLESYNKNFIKHIEKGLK